MFTGTQIVHSHRDCLSAAALLRTLPSGPVFGPANTSWAARQSCLCRKPPPIGGLPARNLFPASVFHPTYVPRPKKGRTKRENRQNGWLMQVRRGGCAAGRYTRNTENNNQKPPATSLHTRSRVPACQHGTWSPSLMLHGIQAVTGAGEGRGHMGEQGLKAAMCYVCEQGECKQMGVGQRGRGGIGRGPRGARSMARAMVSYPH